MFSSVVSTLAGPLPAQTPPRCTKCNSPPINGQCTTHRTAVEWSVAVRFFGGNKGLRMSWWAVNGWHHSRGEEMLLLLLLTPRRKQRLVRRQHRPWTPPDGRVSGALSRQVSAHASQRALRPSRGHALRSLSSRTYLLDSCVGEGGIINDTYGRTDRPAVSVRRSAAASLAVLSIIHVLQKSR